jgi:hypothetical protein
MPDSAPETACLPGARVISPVYLDGPLRGHEHRVEPGIREVPAPGGIRYRLRRFGFAVGGGGPQVMLWIAYCGDEPQVMDVVRVLIRREIMDRAVIL